MSNAVSDEEASLGEEDTIEETDNNSRSIKESKEEVIVPEVVKDETESSLIPVLADNSDIAQTKAKKKSTLSKVGKGLASIIASI